MENIFIVQVCSNYEGVNQSWVYLTQSDASGRVDDYLSEIKKYGYSSQTDYIVGDWIQVVKCKVGQEIDDGEVVVTVDVKTE